MIDMVRLVRTSVDQLPEGEIARQAERLGLTSPAKEIQPALDIFCHQTRRVHDHRVALAEAAEAGASTLLVLEANCLLVEDAASRLHRLIAALDEVDWTVLHLGLMMALPSGVADAGNATLLPAEQNVGAFANLYNARAIDELLEMLPGEPARLGNYVGDLAPSDPARASYLSEDDRGALEATVARCEDRFVAHPMVATTPALLPYQSPAIRDHFGLVEVQRA
ncbi:MAG: hypothetical protein AAFW01_18325 [Pseudomonadota bacterium]